MDIRYFPDLGIIAAKRRRSRKTESHIKDGVQEFKRSRAFASMRGFISCFSCLSWFASYAAVSPHPNMMWAGGGVFESYNIEIGGGRLTVSDVTVDSRYTPPDQMKAAVPDEFRGRHSQLTGFSEPPCPLDVEALRGELLYSSDLDSPESVAGWVAEGPLDVLFENGTMRMRSIDFSEHTVFWCPQEFPESFVAEWEFEPLSQYGLAIIFFAARGEHGEDLFDPALPKRDGRFVHYIRGAITSYHVSYFANVENYQMGRIDL